MVELFGLGVASGEKGEGGLGSLALSLYIFWFMTTPTDVVPLWRGMNHAQPDSSWA